MCIEIILYLSHIETGDDWDMWDSAVATEQIHNVFVKVITSTHKRENKGHLVTN